MRAAKMLCKNKKRPIAMKGGGSAAKKKKKIKVVIPKGTPKFNLARPSQEKRVSYSKSMAYEAGGGVKKMKKGGKTKSRVNEAGNYTKPGMRKRLFNRIKAGNKGGASGQWSARKAQMLASAYKKAGGGYKD